MARKPNTKKEREVEPKGKKYRRFSSLREVAAYYGRSLRTLEKMRAEGKLEPAADRRWDTRLLDPVLGEPTAREPASAAPDDLDSEKKREEILRIKTDREIKEIKREALRGEYLQADEVRSALTTVATIYRKRVLAVGPAVAIHLVGLKSVEEIEVRLRSALVDALKDIAAELRRPIDQLQASAAIRSDETGDPIDQEAPRKG